MANKFSFDHAAFHFMRTNGHGGFLGPFIIAYLIAAAALTATNFGVQHLLFGSFNGLAELLAGGVIPSNQFAAIGAYYLFLLIISAVFWAMFEAAVQRRYVLDEGFSIKFSGDELRLLVVGLLWFLAFLGGYLLFAFVLLLPSIAASAAGAGTVAVALMFITVLGYFCGWIWCAVKLSAASALTIRDKKIKFLDSWGATRGRFWTLLAAYLVLAIIALLIYFGLLGLVFGVTFGGEFVLSDPETFMMLSNPQTLGAMFFVYFLLMTSVQALLLYIWAGPAALIAKTDPRVGGAPNVADEFD
ncbi:MAG: hypothetical protein AAF437_11045 [Pseudomonadota bacterium]